MSATSHLKLHLPFEAEFFPSEWSWHRLDDVCSGVFDCHHTTPELKQEGPIVVRSQDILGGYLNLSNIGHVSEETYRERITRAEPTHGDILYSREGTYFGIAAEVPQNTRLCLGQRMVLIRPVSDVLDTRFLRYWLNSPIMSRHLLGFRDGSVAERLNMSTIRALPVPLPPLAEQRAMTSILGPLDDKIDLNRRMNATLEATARALFQSWFVDFDPVRAKAEGRQPDGMDAETAALFPDRFVESPLGWIPEGWEVGRIGGVAENSRRSVNPQDLPVGTLYIGLEHMPQKSITLSEWGTANDVESNKSLFYRGEFLFGKLRPYFHKVGVAPIDGICSTDILVVTSVSDSWMGFVLFHISSDALVAYTTTLSSGTKMPRTSWRDIAEYVVVLPSENIAAVFSELVNPMLQKLIANVHELHVLTETRDALLPKLISGEVRVGNL